VNDTQFLIALITVIGSVIGTILTLRSQDKQQLAKLKVEIEQDLWTHTQEKLNEMREEIKSQDVTIEKQDVEIKSLRASMHQMSQELQEYHRGTQILIAQILEFPAVPLWQPPKVDRE
jgi:hypothetical protein